MKKFVGAFLFSLLMFNFAANAEDPLQDVMDGCIGDINKFCANVEPGEGRLLACMQSNYNQISKECRYPVNRAIFLASTMELTMSYIAAQCIADAQEHCNDVEPGDGRILSCLAEKSDSLDAGCSQALKDVSQ